MVSGIDKDVDINQYSTKFPLNSMLLVFVSESCYWQRKGGYLVDDEIENPLFFGGDCSNHNSKFSAATHSHSYERTVCLPTVTSILPVDEELISDDEVWQYILYYSLMLLYCKKNVLDCIEQKLLHFHENQLLSCFFMCVVIDPGNQFPCS